MAVFSKISSWADDLQNHHNVSSVSVNPIDAAIVEIESKEDKGLSEIEEKDQCRLDSNEPEKKDSRRLYSSSISLLPRK